MLNSFLNAKIFRKLNKNKHLLIIRAEKDKCQFLCELNDTRASLDHISNEKVGSKKKLKRCFGQKKNNEITTTIILKSA